MPRSPRRRKTNPRNAVESPRATVGFDPTRTGNVERRDGSYRLAPRPEPRLEADDPLEAPSLPIAVQSIQVRLDPLLVFLLGEAAEASEERERAAGEARGAATAFAPPPGRPPRPKN